MSGEYIHRRKLQAYKKWKVRKSNKRDIPIEVKCETRADIMGFEHYIFRCPVCNCLVGAGSNLEDITPAYFIYNYCSECGQRIMDKKNDKK